MNPFKHFKLCLAFFPLIFTIVGLTFHHSAWAQENPNKVEMLPSVAKEASLLGIINNIRKLESQLKQKQEELRSPSGEGRNDQIVDEIKKLSSKLAVLQENFSEVATGVDAKLFSIQSESGEINWGNELKEILNPLVNEVRRLTSRPREVDKLRTDVEELENQILVIDRAIINLDLIKSTSNDQNLLTYINQAEIEWIGRKESIATQLNISHQQLQKKLSERQSLTESVRTIFQLFFKSRGLNLVIALFCAVLFWTIFRRLFHLVQKAFTPKGPQFNLYSRLFSILNVLIAVIGSILVFMMVLYFVEDWVLLILTIMLLLGILWTSKQAVYQFWTHATTLLNIGTVREGERVIYLGIPWVIRSLNLFSNLYNPQILGGELRLPIKDVADLRSRDYVPEEPWFPTSFGDWVLMPDGTVGQVILQSIEFVQLKLLGGSIKWYQTPQFSGLNPTVLSNGFRHLISFGIDYKHQAQATNIICKTLKETLNSKLSELNYDNVIVNLDVQFEEACSSSLNLAVIVDFNGSIAHQHARLRRLLQEICVDACTKNGWNIPFTQMTLHVNPGLRK